MRKIKFRVWDKQFKVWVDPEIVARWAMYVLENPSSIAHEIMQFTGKIDKKGKEIYEGDIVLDDEVIGNIYNNPEMKINNMSLVIKETNEISFAQWNTMHMIILWGGMIITIGIVVGYWIYLLSLMR